RDTSVLEREFSPDSPQAAETRPRQPYAVPDGQHRKALGLVACPALRHPPNTGLSRHPARQEWSTVSQGCPGGTGYQAASATNEPSPILLACEHPPWSCRRDDTFGRNQAKFGAES